MTRAREFVEEPIVRAFVSDNLVSDTFTLNVPRGREPAEWIAEFQELIPETDRELDTFPSGERRWTIARPRFGDVVRILTRHFGDRLSVTRRSPYSNKYHYWPH